MARMGWHYTPCDPHGGRGSDSRIWVAIAVMVAVAVCIGGATRAHSLDGMVRAVAYTAAAVVGVPALVTVIVLAHIGRRRFWAARRSQLASEPGTGRPVLMSATVAPGRPRQAGPLALGAPPPAFDAPYLLSGLPAETVKFERVRKENQP